MKLHLPSALFAAVVAACVAYPAAQAADMGNSYDAQYTYGGTVYTLGEAGGNVLSDTSYESTKGESGWTNGEAINMKAATPATDDGGKLNWQPILSENSNTIRVTQSGTYKYEFNGLNIAGIIVEADNASFTSQGNSGKRSLKIGKAGESYDSYFGGSFNFDVSAGAAGTTFTIEGTQNWYIADGKTVTLTSSEGITNSGTWKIAGGTVAINQTIDNTNGSITADSTTTFQISNIDALKHTFADDWSNNLEQNGAVSLNATYTIADGGSATLTGSQVKYTASGNEYTKTLTTGSFSQEHSGYGVVSNTTLADIADAVNSGGGSFIAIKDGVTLSQGTGASFTSAQKLTGSGKYDRGAIAANNRDDVTLKSNLTLDSTWTGTVSISGGNGTSNDNSNSVAYVDFDIFGNAQSIVEINENGLYCYLTDGADKTFETNILLNGNLTIHNGNSGFAHTFAGTISGEKDIVLNRKGGGANDYTFSNNISGWKGALKAIANTNTVKLSGNATVVNATITNTDDNKTGTLNLTVDNSGKTTTFNKNVTVNKLTGTTAIALGESVALTLTGSNEASSISNLAAHANGNTITLQSGATLNRIGTKSGGTVTLKGAGTYNMSGSPTSNVDGLTDAKNWTGKVTVSGNMVGNGLDFSALGNANSTIEVTSAGVTGYLCSGEQTITSNIVMSGNVALSNGYSTSKKTFAGAVSGTGNFTLAYNSGDETNASFFPQEWNFSGDVSEWSGEFAVQDVAGKQAAKGTLKFSGTSEINLASIAAKKAESAEGAARSELHVTISDADQGETKSAVTVDSVVDATSLTTDTTNGVVLNNAVTVDTLTVQSGTVSGNGNVTVNDTLTVNAADSINLTGSLIFGDGATLTLSESLIQTIVSGEATSYTLATAGSISEGIQLTTALNLDGSKFTEAVLKVQDVPATFDASASTPTQVLVLELTPATTADQLTSIIVNGGSYADGVLTLTMQDVDAAAKIVFGDTLNATMSDEVWDSILEKYGEAMGEQVKVSFADASGNLLDFDGAEDTSAVPTITINGEGTVGTQQITGDGTIVGNYVTAYIPEPTSTTLSLLALAALAARRRRK